MSDGINLDHDTDVAVEFRNEVRELCDEYHDAGLPRAIMSMLLGFEESSQMGYAESDDLAGPLYKLSWRVYRETKEIKEEHDIPDSQVYGELQQIADCYRTLDREHRDDAGGDSDV